MGGCLSEITLCAVRGHDSLPRSPITANEGHILALLMMAASGASKAQLLHRMERGELPLDRDLLLSPIQGRVERQGPSKCSRGHGRWPVALQRVSSCGPSAWDQDLHSLPVVSHCDSRLCRLTPGRAVVLITLLTIAQLHRSPPCLQHSISLLQHCCWLIAALCGSRHCRGHGDREASRRRSKRARGCHGGYCTSPSQLPARESP